MDNFKSILVLLIILVVLILGGYWAVTSIEPGSVHAEREKQIQLEEKNKELEDEIADLKDQLALLQSNEETKQTPTPQKEEPKVEETKPTPAPTPKPTTPTSSSKYQSLINELQGLIKDKITMKEGSRGTRVGTVQKFFNIYKGTSAKIDNDYGATTKADVIKFQKETGMTADGQAGTNTFQKMIDWLKKKG